jgi:hypothetical protein
MLTIPQIKKLIEVAMSVNEISAESIRDKSIHHGHISTVMGVASSASFSSSVKVPGVGLSISLCHRLSIN